MTLASQQGLANSPVRNLRIRFWGVQGSCPIFPTPFGVQEFSHRLSLRTLRRVFDDLQRLAEKNPNSQLNFHELLGGPPTLENLERYQNQIGLPDLPVFGGDTTCIEIETADGNIIILDAGTGIRRCSLEIVHRWANRKDRTLHIFGSHEHLDHRSGLTFSRFCYVEPNPYHIHVYGSFQFLHALDQHYGLFSKEITDVTYIDDPVDYTTMPATFIGTEIRRPGDTGPRKGRHWPIRDTADPIRIGNTTITPFEVYHVIPCCYGFKVEHGGASFVFCTDHEFRHGPDTNDHRQKRSLEAEHRLVEHCANVDLAYMDGQYFLDEYHGKKGIGAFPATNRLDWGHSCIEDVIERSQKCNIKRTLIGHHDPERTWQERAELGKYLAALCAGKENQLQLADSDLIVDL